MERSGGGTSWVREGSEGGVNGAACLALLAVQRVLPVAELGGGPAWGSDVSAAQASHVLAAHVALKQLGGGSRREWGGEEAR